MAQANKQIERLIKGSGRALYKLQKGDKIV